MIFVMYTKDNCPWCEKAKELIFSKSTTNTIDIINVSRIPKTDLDYVKYSLKYWSLKDKVTVPQIFVLETMYVPTQIAEGQTLPFSIFNSLEMKYTDVSNLSIMRMLKYIGGYEDLVDWYDKVGKLQSDEGIFNDK